MKVQLMNFRSGFSYVTNTTSPGLSAGSNANTFGTSERTWTRRVLSALSTVTEMLV